MFLSKCDIFRVFFILFALKLPGLDPFGNEKPVEIIPNTNIFHFLADEIIKLDDGMYFLFVDNGMEWMMECRHMFLGDIIRYNEGSKASKNVNSPTI